MTAHPSRLPVAPLRVPADRGLAEASDSHASAFPEGSVHQINKVNNLKTQKYIKYFNIQFENKYNNSCWKTSHCVNLLL